MYVYTYVCIHIKSEKVVSDKITSPEKGNRRRGAQTKRSLVSHFESGLKVSSNGFHGWIPFCGRFPYSRLVKRLRSASRRRGETWENQGCVLQAVVGVPS